MKAPSGSVGSVEARPALARCFFCDPADTAYEITDIEGRIPPWVRGDYYVNGPARFERGGTRQKNWLDGDGMVATLRFTDNAVRFARRFVRTRKWEDESAADAFLYRTFGTAFPGDRLHAGVMLESPVNVNVIRWGDKVLAFGEQSMPKELDRESLATIGDFDFGGKLNEITPFSAHAKIDPVSGNLLNFGLSYSARQPTLNLYEFSYPGTLVQRRHFPLRLAHANHDFGLGRDHAAFFLSPLRMDFGKFIRERVAVMDTLSWEPEQGSSILVVPRNPKAGSAFEIAAGAGYCLHLINCHEAGRELILDILELDRPVYDLYQPMPDVFREAPASRPVRYVIDLEKRVLLNRRALHYERCADFPAIDPQRLSSDYDDFWLLGISDAAVPGPKFFDQLAHGSWKKGSVGDIHRTPAGEYLGGEPVFIGNPANPKEGLILVQGVNPAKDQGEFLLFDAFAVQRGPVVRLPLRDRMPPLFHACFAAAEAG